MTHGLTAYIKGLCRCDECREANRIATRHHRLRRQGWTEEQFAAALRMQSGKCAICGQPETKAATRGGRVQPLAADHNHMSGKRRGLLCSNCNRILGLTGDSPTWLLAAIKYLRMYDE